MILLVTQPSPYWYATRGLGVTTLVVLTVAVVLGIATANRWSGRATPGFVAVQLHRNFSLLAAFLLVAHVVTTLLDPFAHISLRDAVLPFGAAYRPVWLGLGVASFDVLAAVMATSLLRQRVGPRLWRLVHWSAYASWPLAVGHTLGTGSDARAPWLVATVAASVAAVLLALQNRLRHGPLVTLPVRALASVSAAGVAVVGGAWALTGPLQDGWSARAGSAPVKAARVAEVHAGSAGFSDPLVGVLVRGPGGSTQLSMRDTVDPELTITVRSAGDGETLPVLTVARGTKTLCTTPAAVSTTLYAVCGDTRLQVTLKGDSSVLQSGGSVTGRLDTSGPLR